jgi:hypothetical protein
MAKYADIPITVASPPTEGECTVTYFVEWRPVGQVGWNLLNGNGFTDDKPFRIEPLSPSADYEVRVTRNCCNGLSNFTTQAFTTPA